MSVIHLFNTIKYIFLCMFFKFSSFFRLVKVFQLHLVKIWRHSSLQELCLHWLIAMEIFSGKAGKTSWIVCFSCLRPKCCQSLWSRWGKTSLVERFFSVQSQQRLSVQWANQNWSPIRAASIKRGKKFASKSWLFGACEISDYNRRRFCSRLHGVLYVSIVYPPNWRIMVHLLFSSVHTLYSMACLSSPEHYTALAPWIWYLSLCCQYVGSYAAVFRDVNQRSSPQERKRSNLVPRSLVDEADFVNKRSG